MTSGTAVAPEKAERAKRSSTNMKLIARVSGIERELTLARSSASDSRCEYSIDSAAGATDVEEVEPGVYSILIGSRSFEVKIEESGEGYAVSVNRRRFEILIQDPNRSARRVGELGEPGRQDIASPMPGKVVRVLVTAGDEVEAGRGLVVIEAMKMQNEIKSPRRGKVTSLRVTEGSAVAAGEVLVVVE